MSTPIHCPECAKMRGGVAIPRHCPHRRIKVGEVEATALVFKGQCDDHRYVLTLNDSSDPFVELLRNSFGYSQTKTTSSHSQIDGYGKHFYGVYVADCFDPPIAIIRADNESEAIEWFVDEFDWSHLSDEDLKDYGEDSEAVSYNDSGKPYLNENINLFELTLLTIEVNRADK
jgi:hypothetical protein